MPSFVLESPTAAEEQEAGSGDGLLDMEFLESLPSMDGMDGDFMKPWTPPASAPSSPGSSPEQQPALAASSGNLPPLASYSAAELDKKWTTRLERNRQAAQELRKRKRQYTERIEQEYETFRSQSVQLQAETTQLAARVSAFGAENEFYRGMLANRSGAPSTIPTPATPPNGPKTPKSSKGARGVGVLASLLVMIGMTANYGPAPLGAPGELGDDLPPLNSRRSMRSDDDNELLALPDEELIAHSAGSATATATAVASDVGLVVKTAAEPLVRELSNGSLQLGSQRFVLAAAPDSTAIRWVATPAGGQLGTESPMELSSPAASICMEQDDYILGGPSRSKPTTPPAVTCQNGLETAVAMV